MRLTNAPKKALTGLVIPAIPASLQFAAALTVTQVSGAELSPTPPSRTNNTLQAESGKPLGAQLTAQARRLGRLAKDEFHYHRFFECAKSQLWGDGAAQQQLGSWRTTPWSQTANRKCLRPSSKAARGCLINFPDKNEFENDRLTVEKANLKIKTAWTALGLFIKYEFTKRRGVLVQVRRSDPSVRTGQKEAISNLRKAGPSSAVPKPGFASRTSSKRKSTSS